MAHIRTSDTGHSRFTHSRVKYPSATPASSTASSKADAAFLVQHLKDRADEIAVALLGEPSKVSPSRTGVGRAGMTTVFPVSIRLGGDLCVRLILVSQLFCGFRKILHLKDQSREPIHVVGRCPIWQVSTTRKARRITAWRAEDVQKLIDEGGAN